MEPSITPKTQFEKRHYYFKHFTLFWGKSYITFVLFNNHALSQKSVVGSENFIEIIDLQELYNVPWGEEIIKLVEGCCIDIPIVALWKKSLIYVSISV